MYFILRGNGKDKNAIKDMFRAHRKLFNSVHMSYSNEKSIEVSFTPRSVFRLSEIRNVLRDEHEFGIEFTVEWDVT